MKLGGAALPHKLEQYICRDTWRKIANVHLKAIVLLLVRLRGGWRVAAGWGTDRLLLLHKCGWLPEDNLAQRRRVSNRFREQHTEAVGKRHKALRIHPMALHGRGDPLKDERRGCCRHLHVNTASRFSKRAGGIQHRLSELSQLATGSLKIERHRFRCNLLRAG